MFTSSWNKLLLVIIAFLICDPANARHSPFGPSRRNKCEHYIQLVESKENQQTNASLSLNFEYIDSSKQCAADLGSDWHSYRDCEETEISLDFYTDTLLPHGNYNPYIRLNMSATVFEPSSAIWFVYTCLNSPDLEDEYCRVRDTKPSPYFTPCRGIRIANESNNTQLAPFRADIVCFRIYGLSQYRVDVIVIPQNCRASIYATIPIERQIDPRFSGRDLTELSFKSWSPFVFVEMHAEDGVWVRFQPPPPESRLLEISFSIYIQKKNLSSVHFVRDEIVRLPNTGFKWTNVDAGVYFIYAYVERAHCRLNCNDAKSSQPNPCSTCPHTMINFTLTEPKYTVSWSRTRILLNLLEVIGVCILVILIIVAFGLISVIGYLKYLRPIRYARRPPQNFELVARPRVLFLYTDDCDQHTECVQQLAYILRSNASARIYIDMQDLNDPSVRATNWLVNKLACVDFVLIIFSAGSRRVMEGETMRERRPFPDLFNPALRLIVTKITSIISRSPALHQESSLNNSRQVNAPSLINRPSSNATKQLLKKFVVLRFSYTPKNSIAEFFPLVGCKDYQIPDELPQLVAHLHNFEVSRNSILEFSADYGGLNNAIMAFEQFRNSNPNYLEERFSSDLPHYMGINQLTGAEIANPNLPEHTSRTDQEILALLDKYKLETAQCDEDNLETSRRGIDLTNFRIQEEYPLVGEDEKSIDENA